MSDSTAKKGCIAASATARTYTALAAAVVSAAGIGVINAVPAGAIPPAPLAPACANWKMPSPELVLNLANGQTAVFQTSGNRVESGRLLVPGNTNYSGNTSGPPMGGSNLDFGVSWRRTSGNFGGENGAFSVARFIGEVAGDGIARGSALDNENARVDWVSRDRFTCADEPPQPTPPPQQEPPPPQQAPPQQAPPVATVTGDVDLYDAPGGGGNVIGILRAGNKVDFVGCRADNWCEVKGGWVWGDFLQKP